MDDYNKDFDRWNGIKKNTNCSKHVSTKVGEIFWCKFGVNIGTEQDGKGNLSQRPGIVIKKFSKEIVLIAPLTTKIHTGDWYCDIDFGSKKSSVILNQIKPIDTKRLINSIGQISEQKIKDILNRYVNLILTK